MPDPPRPTIRCLLEDLAETVEDPRQRSALRASQLPDLTVRLHDIDHPIVAAARDRYAEGEPRARDRYRSVRDHPWVECRHGERWRGLVLWHADAQCWLGFAGWHEAGSPDDVYERFTGMCTSGRTIDSSRFLPTGEDDWRLRAEQRQVVITKDRHVFQRGVIECLLAAVSVPEIEQTVPLPDGSQLRVVLRPDGDIDELTLTVTIDWRGGEGAPIVEQVKDAVPGIATNEWDILPPGPSNLDPAFLVYVDRAWVGRLTEAAATHGLDILGADPNLVLDPSDGAAHVIPDASRVSAAYVEGQPVRAICGRRFIPHADPSNAEPCPECDDLKKKLQAQPSK